MKMKDYFGGMWVGLMIGALLAILATQFGPIDYKIESVATEDGITYGVTYDTWSRKDLLFATDDPNFAWTMWYYLKAQQGDLSLDSLTPEESQGSFDPKDYAKKSKENEEN